MDALSAHLAGRDTYGSAKVASGSHRWAGSVRTKQQRHQVAGHRQARGRNRAMHGDFSDSRNAMRLGGAFDSPARGSTRRGAAGAAGRAVMGYASSSSDTAARRNRVGGRSNRGTPDGVAQRKAHSSIFDKNGGPSTKAWGSPYYAGSGSSRGDVATPSTASSGGTPPRSSVRVVTATASGHFSAALRAGSFKGTPPDNVRRRAPAARSRRRRKGPSGAGAAWALDHLDDWADDTSEDSYGSSHSLSASSRASAGGSASQSGASHGESPYGKVTTEYDSAAAYLLPAAEANLDALTPAEIAARSRPRARAAAVAGPAAASVAESATQEPFGGGGWFGRRKKKKVANRPGTGWGSSRGKKSRGSRTTLTGSSASWDWGNAPEKLAPPKSARQAVEDDDESEDDQGGLTRKKRENPYAGIETLVRETIDNIKLPDAAAKGCVDMSKIAMDSNRARDQLRAAVMRSGSASAGKSDLEQLHQQAVLCTEIGRAGGVNAIIRAMNYHRFNRKVTLRGCWALEQLLEDGEKHAVAFQVSPSPPNASYLPRRPHTTLPEENRATFMARDGVAVLESARKVFSKDEEIKKSLRVLRRMPGLGRRMTIWSCLPSSGVPRGRRREYVRTLESTGTEIEVADDGSRCAVM